MKLKLHAFYKVDEKGEVRPYAVLTDASRIIRQEFFIDELPEEMADASATVKMFFHPAAPCPFPDTLLPYRQRYLAEMQFVLASEIDLVRRRMEVIRRHYRLLQHFFANLPDTPPQELVDRMRFKLTPRVRPETDMPVPMETLFPQPPVGERRRRGPIPVEEREIMVKFNSDEPCFFPGCEELRQERDAVIDEAGGEKCPGCTRGRIMQQYAERALRAAKSNVEEKQ